MWEFIGYATLGLGWAMIMFGMYVMIDASASKIMASRARKKEPAPMKEVSELLFRNKNGAWETVKIIIDHSDYDRGEPDGVMKDIMAGSQTLTGIDEFVFTPSAVTDMRDAGMEVDDVVINMLRASGRM